MHIGMVTACYPPVVNGVTRMVVQYEEHLRQAGHQVTVFTLGKAAADETTANVVRSRAAPLGTSGYYFALGYNRAAQEKIAQVDIIHCHHLLMGMEFAKRYGKVPIVFTNHTRYDVYLSVYGHLPFRVAAPLAGMVWRNYAGDADAIIAPCRGIREILRAAGLSVPIRVIENGVDVGKYQRRPAPDQRARLGIPPAAVLFTYVGRLSAEKNIWRLLAEIEVVLRDSEQLHFLLVGDGPLRKRLEQRVAASSMTGRVHLAGLVAAAEVPQLLATSDGFVTASLSEVHPLTVIEAQCAGLPVVAFDSPGINEIVVHDRSGLLASGAPGSLADAIRKLAEDQPYRARLAMAARTIGAGYDIRRTVEKTVELYGQLLGASDRSAKTRLVTRSASRERRRFASTSGRLLPTAGRIGERGDSRS